MPVWTIVSEDLHHNATPGAFILGAGEKSAILAKGLRKVAENVPNGNWDPNFTIDKDVKEFRAVKEDLKDIFTGQVCRPILVIHF